MGDRNNMTNDNSRRLSRRSILKTAGASSATAALAGCPFIGGDGDATTTQADTDTQTQTQTDMTGTETDEPGTTTTQQNSGIPSEIDAGLLSFMSGAPAVLGVQAARGAELAVQRVNQAGGVAGQARINLEVKDEASNALDKYSQFIDGGADVTFGPISSGTHKNLAQQVEQNEVVNVGTDGTVTTLYESDVPDPTYSFRFQNYDIMEATAMAVDAVNRLGAENIDTYAGVNPGYSFGEDEFKFFGMVLEKLTGAEMVYEGFPDLGASDMSSHIQSINSNQPDVTFSSLWGGDVTTFLQQASSRNMHENTTVFGSVLYSAAGDVPQEALGADIYSGSRNYYWNLPEMGKWKPGQDLFDAARQQDGITVPTAHYMSGYGAVTAWVTAVEKYINMTGNYPNQEQIAGMLEGHGFFTPAGYHVMAPDHQGMSNAYSGKMEYNEDLGAAELVETNVVAAKEVSPPPGTMSEDWINSWS